MDYSVFQKECFTCPEANIIFMPIEGTKKFVFQCITRRDCIHQPQVNGLKVYEKVKEEFETKRAQFLRNASR